MTKEYYTFLINHLLRVSKNNGLIENNYFTIQSWLKQEIQSKVAEEENALRGYFSFDPTANVFYWYCNDSRINPKDAKTMVIFVDEVESVSLKSGSPLRYKVWKDSLTLTLKTPFKTHTFYLQRA